MTIAIIDGDSIPYICSKDSYIESVNNVDNLIRDIKDKTGSTHYYLFLSSSPYFRHSVDPNYKGHRGVSPLKYLRSLKQYLIEEYGAIIVDKVEADDLLAFTMGNVSAKVVGCSPDKDVIHQIPGLHYNYKKGEFTTTTPIQATKFLFKQVLTGDAADNIKGVPGIGEKKAESILAQSGSNRGKVFAAYLKYYKEYAAAEYEYQKNFRLVYLLRTQTDFQNEVNLQISLPEPLVFKDDTGHSDEF